MCSARRRRTEKFATYYRDPTGLDYAWNRHYTAAWGRFMQADPYLAPEALKNPQAWNRYAYVMGDPVNYCDPAGFFIEVPVPFPPLPPVYNVTTVLAENRWVERLGEGVPEVEAGGEVFDAGGGLRPFQDYARSLVESWLDELPKSNCWKYLKGHANDLREALAQTRFYDATGEHAGLRLSQIFPGVNIINDRALKDLNRPPGAFGVTLTLDDKITPNVVIWESELPYPGAIFYLLAHEMLHVATRMNDADLRKQFGLTSEADLTEWLTKDCK